MPGYAETSQDSPILLPRGNDLLNWSRSVRPPQIISLKYGLSGSMVGSKTDPLWAARITPYMDISFKISGMPLEVKCGSDRKPLPTAPKGGETLDGRREMISAPYGISCRYDNGRKTGTVSAKTLW